MPLITFCGPPCSGKTTRAQELREFILTASEGRFKVVLINLETLSLDRSSSHTTPSNEKETRGSMKSLVDKSLSKDTIVICDYLNYIKGVRYELFCLARAIGTSHCVVFVDVAEDVCVEWNRSFSTPWPEELLRALHSRMERPYEGQKWDRPLFHCHMDDPTPCEDILHYCISEGSDLRPSAATQPQRLADSNFLHILDATTQEISREILIAQERGMAGDKAKMPHSAELFIIPESKLTAAVLKKHKKRFARVLQLRTPSADAIGDAFIHFLNTVLEG
eukprot:TRINITY_DN1079_c0_g1_i2.p1 TRINITY_DN1079_c0_g1~~TRINITY_DN1079_c0_g1_i2.p1  ORF type:complete len:278 (-),score=75.97 TRINITY_DN1079_c0_g1_i2:945-1778(-)